MTSRMMEFDYKGKIPRSQSALRKRHKWNIESKGLGA